jgi:hypothetical protein
MQTKTLEAEYTAGIITAKFRWDVLLSPYDYENRCNSEPYLDELVIDGKSLEKEEVEELPQWFIEGLMEKAKEACYE